MRQRGAQQVLARLPLHYPCAQLLALGGPGEPEAAGAGVPREQGRQLWTVLHRPDTPGRKMDTASPAPTPITDV